MSDSEVNELQHQKEQVDAVVHACIELRDFYEQKLILMREIMEKMSSRLAYLERYKITMDRLTATPASIMELYKERKGLQEDIMTEASNEYEDGLRDAMGDSYEHKQ